ncbi:MAG: nuclear transport factor 2 family protein [Bacteroidota bacterium]
MENKKQNLAIGLIMLLGVLVGLPVMGSEKEKEAVVNVVTSAYVEGFQNLGGKEMMEAGFHPTFVMVLNRGGQLSELPLARMIGIVEQRLANPDYQHVPVEAKILDVDVTGNAAMVKLELYREGKLLFTDYLGLYKFENGWKIFNKLYNQH